MNKFQLFILKWKSIPNKIKINVAALVLMVLVIPVSVNLALNQARYRSRANVVTPPTPPIPPTPGLQNALQLINDPQNDTYAESSPNPVLTQSPFTIEAWVKVFPPLSGNYLRSYNLFTYTKPQSPADRGYIFNLSLEVQEGTGMAKPFFSILKADSNDYINSNYFSIGGNSDTEFKPNTWTHLAVTGSYEGNNCYLNLFINGSFKETNSIYKDNCHFSTQQPQAFQIAKPPLSSGGISGYYFHGQIDEVRVSNTVRYKNDVNGTYALPINFDNDANTLILYHLDELVTGDSSIKDFSSNANYAKIFGPGASIVPRDSSPTPTPSPSPSPIIVSPAPSSKPSPSLSPKPSVKPSPKPINNPPLILTNTLKNAKRNRQYSYRINGIDLDKNDSLFMSVTDLPQGIKLDSCREVKFFWAKYIYCFLRGKPANSGKFKVTITLQDSQGVWDQKILPLTVYK